MLLRNLLVTAVHWYRRAFCVRFAFGQRRRKIIQNWVSNFRQTGSTLKIKPTSRPTPVTGPKNVVAVKASIERCARKYAAAALQLSDHQRTKNFAQRIKNAISKAKWTNNVPKLWKPRRRYQPRKLLPSHAKWLLDRTQLPKNAHKCIENGGRYSDVIFKSS